MAWTESNVQAQNVLHDVSFSVTTVHAEHFTDLELAMPIIIMMTTPYSNDERILLWHNVETSVPDFTNTRVVIQLS